jgi:hypothetical protein
MSKKRLLYRFAFAIFSLLSTPGAGQALPLFGQGEGLLRGTWTWSIPSGNIRNPGVTERPVTERVSWTNQQELVLGGDITFQKVSLRLACDFDSGNNSFTMTCTDATNRLSANYQLAFMETDRGSKSEDVFVYIWGTYDGNINGVQKNGGLSVSLLSGKEKSDSAGNLVSTTLSGTIYGAIDNDSAFQVKVKLTLIP